MFKSARSMAYGMAALGLAVTASPFVRAQGRAYVPGSEPARLEMSMEYSFMRGNAGPGNCGCFNLHGGSTEVTAPVWRGFSAVGTVVGEHTSNTNLPTQPLSLVVGAGGPRFTYARGRYRPFVEGLVGVAHGFDAPFPTASASGATAATSLAVLLGGGLDIGVTRHFAVRAFSADYGLTHLPNSVNNQQNLLRISGGVVFRAW